MHSTPLSDSLQVSITSYFPGRKMYFSWMNGQTFFWFWHTALFVFGLAMQNFNIHVNYNTNAKGRKLICNSEFHAPSVIIIIIIMIVITISLILSSLIHLVDFLDPLINNSYCYFLQQNLILRLMVACLLLLLHPLFGMHFHSSLDLAILFLLLNLSLRLGFLKFLMMSSKMMMFYRTMM